MQRNKVILGYCPNFDKIMSADFLEGDKLSNQLVKIYKDYIFNIDINNLEDIGNVRKIDEIMAKYVEDYFFRKIFQDKLTRVQIKKNVDNVIKAVVISIIDLFKGYEDETTRIIYISRWI